jgi:hypothetical protein
VASGTPEAAAADPAKAPPAPTLDRFAPTPEPRADWARDWSAPVATTPERWYEPAPSIEPVRATTAPRRGAGAGSLVLVSLLSAVLASGGTVLALGAAGALDRPVTAPTTALGTNVGAAQPVTIDESSATINVAAKVSRCGPDHRDRRVRRRISA